MQQFWLFVRVLIDDVALQHVRHLVNSVKSAPKALIALGVRFATMGSAHVSLTLLVCVSNADMVLCVLYGFVVRSLR